MNNNQQSLIAALTAFQSSLERMNMTLVDSFKPSLLASSSAFQPALLEFQRSIAQTMTISPQSDMATQLQAQLDALTAPVRQMQEVWNASLVSGIRDSLVSNDAVLKQTRIFQESMSSLASAFQGISIHENYVSVPEMLIPDDYVYEEAIPKSLDHSSESSKMAMPIKKLSYSDALTIIGILIQLLCWTISFIQTSQSSLQEQQNHQELVALQEESNRLLKESNRLQEERNQILQQQIDSTEKQVEYLLTIYSTIQESDLAPQDTDFGLGDTRCSPATPDSATAASEESHPTEADGSENSEPR